MIQLHEHIGQCVTINFPRSFDGDIWQSYGIVTLTGIWTGPHITSHDDIYKLQNRADTITIDSPQSDRARHCRRVGHGDSINIGRDHKQTPKFIAFDSVLNEVTHDYKLKHVYKYNRTVFIKKIGKQWILADVTCHNGDSHGSAYICRSYKHAMRYFN